MSVNFTPLAQESDGGTPRNSDPGRRPDVMLDNGDTYGGAHAPGASTESKPQDPFFIVQAEIKDAVTVASELLARWRRTSTDTDPDWELSTAEIQSYVSSAKASLCTLEEGMAIIRSHRRKFRLSEAEVSSREEFIVTTRGELEAITRELDESRKFRMTGDKGHSGFQDLSPTTRGGAISAYPPQSGDSEPDAYDFDPRRGGREQGITIHVGGGMSGMVPGGAWGTEEDQGQERRPGCDGEGCCRQGYWQCRDMLSPACIVAFAALFAGFAFLLWFGGKLVWGGSGGGG